jgi:hypothetical protein
MCRLFCRVRCEVDGHALPQPPAVSGGGDRLISNLPAAGRPCPESARLANTFSTYGGGVVPKYSRHHQPSTCDVTNEANDDRDAGLWTRRSMQGQKRRGRPCCSLLGLESERTQAAGFLRSCLCLEVTRSEVCTDAGRNQDYRARHKKAILGQRRSLSLCLTLGPCRVPPRRPHGPVVDTGSFPLTLLPPDPSPKERTARKERHPAEARACLVDTSHQPCQRLPL